MSPMDVPVKLRKFIKETFLNAKEVEDLGDDDSLLDSGIVDSMGILQLVNYLESQFGVDVQDEEIVPENFETVTTIAKFVGTKLESKSS